MPVGKKSIKVNKFHHLLHFCQIYGKLRKLFYSAAVSVGGVKGTTTFWLSNSPWLSNSCDGIGEVDC